MDSHGGWVLSTIDLLKFMKGVFEGNFLTPSTMNEVTSIPNRVPMDPDHPDTSGYYGLGWVLIPAGTEFRWTHDGSLPGTTSRIVRTTWSDGSDVCWAALLNSRDNDQQPKGSQIGTAIDGALWVAMQSLSSLPDPISLVWPWQASGVDPTTYQQILNF
jgi:hypothetical protein